MSDDSTATVTVPIPLPFQRNYGVHSTRHHDAHRVMQRFNAEDYEVVRRQCTRLGITIAAFVREAAVNVAKALEIQEKNNAKHDLRS